MPCTTMQGQILFSFIYDRTKAADRGVVSIVGPKPKNFKWTSVNKSQDIKAATHLCLVNIAILSMRYPR
jgi:uncharacterized membrane protein YkgB